MGRTVGPMGSEQLLDLLEEQHTAAGRGLLVTGAHGAGKTRMLRAASATLQQRGSTAPVLAAHSVGGDVPLGLFLGVADLAVTMPSSPAGIIDAFARRRSTSALLVDGVEHVDPASLFVILKLVQTTRLPAILTATDIAAVPDGVRALCDSGDLAPVSVLPLTRAEAAEIIERELGGQATPAAVSKLALASGGSPLQLVELIAGSRDSDRLVESEHGWELRDAPMPTPRLAERAESKLAALSPSAVDAVTCAALAGEYPSAAIAPADRRALAHAGLIETTASGWIRLIHPLDAEHLRTRGSSALRRELVGESIRALREASASGDPGAARRADALAVRHGYDIDPDAAVGLAEHALGAFDEPLALLAAKAALAGDPSNPAAHRVVGSAASALGETSEADASFRAAQMHVRTDAERVSVALAMAQHLGGRRHDAAAALAVLADAAAVVDDDIAAAHLVRARMRWASVAGRQSERVESRPVADVGAVGADAALGLITTAMGGLISGPLDDAERLLPDLRRIPDEVLALVPGGASLIDLAEVMALSYSGDVLATRRSIQEAIASAGSQKPESLGAWEYALGVLELFSADADVAHQAAQSATVHLDWRDAAGLLPAAYALTGAAALAAGRTAQSTEAFEQIPDAAADDPKVVMLSGWVRARGSYLDGRRGAAGETLLATAEGLLAAQHTYFGGMLAHCAVRLGHDVPAAAAVLRRAASLAGGGMLELFVQHAEAAIAGDADALDALAEQAAELGLVSTAVDIWTGLSIRPALDATAELRARRCSVRAAELLTDAPGVPLWAGQPDRSAQLTEREHKVARLAAERLTTKEIAERHGVSPHTVNNQLAAIYRKLGVTRRAELREVLRPD